MFFYKRKSDYLTVFPKNGTKELRIKIAALRGFYYERGPFVL
jgi:hypothetical protein